MGQPFLMNTWTLSDEAFNKFAPDECLFDHFNGTVGDLTYYVDDVSQLFVVFMKGFDTVSQLSEVTAWLITGKASRCEFMVHEQTALLWLSN